MAATEFPLNDPQAVQRWSERLTREASLDSYYSKFEGGMDAMIYVKKELHKAAGDKVRCSIRMRIGGEPKYGDATLEGSEAEVGLDFFHDDLFIDQMRKSIKTKGKATEQRVPWNLRKESMMAHKEYWVDLDDQITAAYLAGARGSNADWLIPTTWTGQKTTDEVTVINALTAPDADHITYAGSATGSADMVATDIATLQDIDLLKVKAKMSSPMIKPVKNGKYIALMHYYQGLQMRQGTSDNDWLAIHKATDRGPKSMMYKDAMGEYAGVILHEHDHCVLFDDYGAGSNLPAARLMFLGAQAGLKAYGQKNKKNRYNLFEELDDRGNALVVAASKICGTKGTVYNSKWYGRLCRDSAVPVI